MLAPHPGEPPDRRSLPAAPLLGWPYRVAFTAVLIGYFLPWLNHEAAGLTLIGLDVSEWLKFLPQVVRGDFFLSRDVLYLPPVILGALLILSTASWPPRSRPALLRSGLGILVALLAFPSLEAIRFEGAGEWVPRVTLIAGVLGLAVLIGTGKRPAPAVITGLASTLALVGTALPAWFLIGVRPIVTQWLGIEQSLGSGFWLNTAGFLIVALAPWARRTAAGARREFRR